MRGAGAAAGTRRGALRGAAAGASLAALAALGGAGPAAARLEGVDRPDLLPGGGKAGGSPEPLLDPAGFLTEGERERVRKVLSQVERDSGVRFRIVAQNYPETPGLAVRDYWGVDADTVVLVADPGLGQALNFNVGQNVDLLVPRPFWSRLSGKYGTKKYVEDHGMEEAIQAAVAATQRCLAEPPGKLQCVSVDGSFDGPGGAFVAQ